ncbi:hypothetical protein NE237_012364 [Protea cynaroides]|uniref:NADP-dependent oxidoreductase domain-containing protein n=1 Tax=Protea cynaroides TaxID=273540 RepID=A0A9Q0GWN2_9MAGN|nr:hypothetical protein NE237_012364 [Protea cynaroides]
MSKEKIQIPIVKLGNQGLEVSKLGFGCCGLSGTYNDPPLPVDVGISVIKEAFNSGITFFDTSDIYGPNTNEILVGKALKQLPRDKIQLAPKFGIVNVSRLDVDYIDLYYQHRSRVDKSVSIEDTVGRWGNLRSRWKGAGKIRYIGLSEASPDTIRRAHAIHPITAVQMEWSLWTRDIEKEIVALCRSPTALLVVGFFGGKAVKESIPANSFLIGHPRFTGENLEKSKVPYKRVANLAAKHGCIPAQLALSWVLHQGDDVVPIPGTTKLKNLDEIIGSLRVKLKLSTEKFSPFITLKYFNTFACKLLGRLLVWKIKMSKEPTIQIPRVKLGNQGLEVSKLGFGCCGLSGIYNDPLPVEVGISVIKEAYNRGITFFDTSDIYGSNTNEILVGKALKQLPRDKVQLATKFGIVNISRTGLQVNGSPKYVRKCCKASLKRLDVDYIDLYFYILDYSPDTIRRAHAIHPITAVQMEWSLWTRDIEEEIIPLCSPLGRGFFGGKAVTESVPANSFLVFQVLVVIEILPAKQMEFQGSLVRLYNRVANLAAKHGCTPAQLALSWVLHQGDDVVPIPGTTKF